MNPVAFHLPWPVLAPLVAVASDVEPIEGVPSYGDAVQAFNEERAKAGGPGFRPGDRRVMEQAARDLAAAMPQPGLRVGEQAPDFILPNAFGDRVRLSELLAHGPLVLVFYRGAWCPYCNLQLQGLKQSLPHIERAGARLVAVAPQKPDKSREQGELDGYPFEILSDLNDSVMKSYRVYLEVPEELSGVYKERLSLDLAEYNGDGRYVLPVPATFVIDRVGIVRSSFADVDYRKRVEPARTVAAVRALAAGSGR